MKIKLFQLIVAMSGISVLSACTSSGEIDNIFKRKATWASFLSGEDIARACAENSGTHIRFTYNGNRAKQVRFYDLVGMGEGWDLRSRVLEAGVPVKAMTMGEIMAAPNPVDKSRRLSEAQAQAVLSGLKSAMTKKGVRPGERIFSPSYFWLAASCQDGVFTFRAWDYPDRGFADAEFAPYLFDYDPIDIPVSQPKGDQRITPITYGPFKRELDNFEHYELSVKESRVILGQTFPPDRNK
ncbi:hypothetical protein [Aestuariispira ectoiniformans]|uniref:hypothetical protein n=1 Tax=Aestuariispira ectoiniformans TaxID=2775080 RepID=UPI00223AB934|nr:hypothetical protein [Aestuariispira ectoiniformans]